MRPRSNLAALVAATIPACAAAESPDASQALGRIVVTATRIERADFDVPAAIDAVDTRAMAEDKLQVNLSEALNRVPGIVAQNRQNYAQDLQISSRGFGARSTFGVRGVRLIADGIPATMPDGQGQAATFNLPSAQRIEVLRGPFAALYGNSSGGVVQIFTADGPPEPTVTGSFDFGSYGQRREGVQFGGQSGNTSYIADLSRFETDGYRDHSAARRDALNAKVKLALPIGRLTLLFNALEQPDTQDPLGLTRAQWEANPRQADSSAIAFDTRKSVRQNQAGAVLDFDNASVQWQAKVYGGDRQVTQYLGQTGDTPLGAGGVVDLDRTYGGLGLRGTRVFGTVRPLTLTAGLDADRLNEHRRGFVNNFGSQGAPRRDEDDKVTNTDAYAQVEWALHPRWIASGGVRYSRVRFDSRDHFITGANPDDSGSIEYTRTLPVAGILFKAADRINLYASAGRGFETPTFAELAYRPGGATGLNFALQPAKSRQGEIGAKALLGEHARLDVAAFRIETDDEIVVNRSSGGRSDYKNASHTRRDGLEASFGAKLPGGFDVTLAQTWLAAHFTEGFASGTPAVIVPAGAKLPGVPRSVFHAEATWRHASGFHAGAELHYASKIFVNEANTDAAGSYAILNLHAGLEQRWGRWRLKEFVRVENAADRRYAGSVIVSEARGRFFEPAPGRNALAGAQASLAF